MKRLCILLSILFTFIFVPMNLISADEDPTMNLNIIINNDDSNKVVVSIPDDSKYSSLKPEISINTSFSAVKVEKNGSNVNYTLNNGKVTFIVDDFDCDYIITNANVNGDVDDVNHRYVFPKTGVN